MSVEIRKARDSDEQRLAWISRQARAEALRRNALRVTLRVLSTNERALRLYRAAGYEVEGTLRGEFYVQGRFVDDVLMALDPSA